MPFINSHILNAFIDKYKKNKKPKPATDMTFADKTYGLFSILTDSISTVTGGDTNSKRESQSEDYQARFRKLEKSNDPALWADELAKLGLEAWKAQSNKTFNWSRLSDFSEVLHAIRNYILREAHTIRAPKVDDQAQNQALMAAYHAEVQFKTHVRAAIQLKIDSVKNELTQKEAAFGPALRSKKNAQDRLNDLKGLRHDVDNLIRQLMYLGDSTKLEAQYERFSELLLAYSSADEACDYMDHFVPAISQRHYVDYWIEQNFELPGKSRKFTLAEFEKNILSLDDDHPANVANIERETATPISSTQAVIKAMDMENLDATNTAHPPTSNRFNEESANHQVDAVEPKSSKSKKPKNAAVAAMSQPSSSSQRVTP